MVNLAELIEAVETADSKAAMVMAVRHLAAAQHPEAIPTLIAVLGYNNPGAAVAAVDGLVTLGRPAVPALLDQLDGYNYGARAWAIRALALIGDPLALPVLLETAAGDFALSVRRAAVRGLGNLNWEWLAADQVLPAQSQALQVLRQSTQDPEWVVRYAAVVGLETLALARLKSTNRATVEAIAHHLQAMLTAEETPAVQARAWLAFEVLRQL
ncbi:MAG TPA: HEAT repeat domain-containing protein [Leptolyngbyaceae cyanobacterium M65_K2018_010]|nr:HEAT repeat domain-containing protein [Leptolyngbyaceae cyanobacterium M65_K2018_010]